MNESFVLPGMSDFKVWDTIHKFSEIEIKPNTLILCDIDDTLLHHPCFNSSWTLLIHQFFFTQSRTIFGNKDPNAAYKSADRYCEEMIRTIPIRHTDEAGFFDMKSKAADFAFLTARHPSSRDFTNDNLRRINIDPETVPIYFCGDIAKGDYINQFIDLTKYDYVVFIDDQLRNLENVYLTTSHPRMEIYRFENDIGMHPFDYYPLPPGFNPRLKFDGELLREIELA